MPVRAVYLPPTTELTAHAGNLTTEDMVSLFNPVPFGVFKPSALSLALADAPQLWDRLRSIDSDKEAKMLVVRCLATASALSARRHPGGGLRTRKWSERKSKKREGAMSR